MIKNLTGHVRFLPSGETLSVKFQPKDGITAVVGANGVGKTFTALESVRYLLFGTQALRGVLADYAELNLVGDVEIQGADYTISRSLSKAKLTDASGASLAVGTEAVTAKVIDLLGYNLKVFDICNASLQKQADSFGKLRPADRKALTDDLLKVTDVKLTEKACREQATFFKNQAEAMTQVRRNPGEPPVVPATYRPSEELRKELDEAQRINTQRAVLEGKIRPVPCPRTPDTPRPVLQQLAALTQATKDHAALAQMHERLRCAEPDYSVDELRRMLVWARWKEEERQRGPQPTMTELEVQSALAIYHQLELASEDHGEDVTCPKCDHKFRTGSVLPKKPAASKAELLEQNQRLVRWSTPLPPPPSDGLSTELTPAQVEAKLRNAERWAEFKSLPPLGPDPTQELEALRQADKSWDAYDREVQAKQLVEAENDAAETQLKLLPAPRDISQLNDAWQASKAYEAEKARYESDLVHFLEVSKTIDEKLELAQQFRDGAKELSEARAELKSFLAPALSRVASELLDSMTNGVLTAVVVDDDMEITVDGQRLSTLSGAGETVANLALRLAFSKILTGSSFSVFIGDEMDGDLDAARREATAQAFLSQKKNFKQLILITHRDVDIADHVIALGEPQ